MPRYVDPIHDIGEDLIKIEKSARYVGGEFGLLSKKEALFQTVIAFPDLYEIGMSNQALKILYNNLNALHDISCGRVFAPDSLFEKLLRDKQIPLYDLDTGIALKDIDLLMFTLGYELGITGALSILDAAKIPILAKDRTDDHPIIIMGGPCVSNPLPFSQFIDFFWIGEAEDDFFNLVSTARDLKAKGAAKSQINAIFANHPSVWFAGKEKAVRNINHAFSTFPNSAAIFPIPSMRIVQHHGAVEIMRGCPNGCRFCHAGFWYRPMRQKKSPDVLGETRDFIEKGGYREISLSSLSSGDYAHLDNLLDTINDEYARKHISFQLPSLHVSTFSLPLLEKISSVRLSGLTFAVETPLDMWQISINKVVTLAMISDILSEAKKRGWRGIKFYFMIGLPVTESEAPSLETQAPLNEEDEIIAFIDELSKRTKLKFNINVGVFIPKPHTPYQWAAQLDEDTAKEKLWKIKDALKRKGHKVSIHDAFVSYLEGIMARGDERVGELIKEAYESGCRLDAWSEYFKKDVWRAILGKNNNWIKEITQKRNLDDTLPWHCIQSGITQNYMKNELEQSNIRELTSICMKNCTHNCGVCTYSAGIVENNIHSDNYSSEISKIDEKIIDSKKDPDTYRLIFSFAKQGKAVFLSHLSLIEVFSMAFARAGTPVFWTEGFNPLPKLDFASPISVGITAAGEIASIDTTEFVDPEMFTKLLNSNLPEGLSLNKAACFFIPSGTKKYSVMSLLWGFRYEGQTGQADTVQACNEKQYRIARSGGNDGSIWGLNRLGILAKSAANANGYDDYFDVYKQLYQQ